MKGETPTQEECEKASMLSEDTGKDVFLFYGDIPDPASPYGVAGSEGALAWGEEIRNKFREDFSAPQDEHYYWTQCHNLNCSSLYRITKNGRADLLPCDHFVKLCETLWSDLHGAISAEELRLLYGWLVYRDDTRIIAFSI